MFKKKKKKKGLTFRVRTNARKINLETFHRGQFTASIQLIKPNYLVISPSPTLEIYPLYLLDVKLSNSSLNRQINSLSYTLLPCAITGQLLIAMNWL